MDARSRLGRLTRSRWVAGAVGAAVLLAWALFLRGQLHELQGFSWQVAPLALLVSVIGGACYFGGLAVCWALLLRQVSAAEGSPPLGAATRIWLLSMITRYIPGNVWHILSRVALARQLNVSGTQVLASATVEQALTLLGALTLWGLTLPFWRGGPTERIWLLALLPVGLLLMHPRIGGGLLGWVASKVGRPALAWRYTYGDILMLLGGYLVTNVCAGCALAILLWGLTPVAISDLPVLIGAAALAWSVGYLSFFTPSGLGVREAVLVAILSQLYPAPIAVVAPLVFRVSLTVGEVLAVAIAALGGKLTSYRSSKVNTREPSR